MHELLICIFVWCGKHFWAPVSKDSVYMLETFSPFKSYRKHFFLHDSQFKMYEYFWSTQWLILKINCMLTCRNNNNSSSSSSSSNNNNGTNWRKVFAFDFLLRRWISIVYFKNPVLSITNLWVELYVLFYRIELWK